MNKSTWVWLILMLLLLPAVLGIVGMWLMFTTGCCGEGGYGP